MHHILEDGDEFFDPRSSTGSSCLLPQWMLMDSHPRRSSSYVPIPQEPFRLTVLKFDGSSFGIEVVKTGMVGDVKHAVEEAFGHLPKNGPGGVSWAHVWGQFCLCYDGLKLLNDSDCIGSFGINDGDQLEFIRHYSSNNLVGTQSETEESDLDDEPSVLNGYREEPDTDEQIYYHRIDIEDNWDDELDKRGISERQSSLSHLFRCWFRYSKMSRSQMRTEKRSNSLEVPYSSNSGSFKDVIRLHNNSTNSRRETWKGLDSVILL